MRIICTAGAFFVAVVLLSFGGVAQGSGVVEGPAADTTAVSEAQVWINVVALFQAMALLSGEAEALSDPELEGVETPYTDEVEAQEQGTDPTRLELDGLVVDETRSRHGRDFYDLFYSGWDPPDGAINYTVRVQEQPGRGMGTIISVQVNDSVVYRTQLQPRYEVVEQAAQQAVAQTQRIMQEYDVSRTIF